ncbi:hypothetical protein BD311DRAFT_429078 [Dichomitus squalens]|uniref:Uncharacterized protein n=1 Tax=Dichomitus squalens TaxID=114155 RepID=A0A4Q9MI39_9APHY|nr:hypothetical protein BD311DRAFT_429078 [Dichomitus squalens]
MSCRVQHLESQAHHNFRYSQRMPLVLYPMDNHDVIRRPRLRHKWCLQPLKHKRRPTSRLPFARRVVQLQPRRLVPSKAASRGTDCKSGGAADAKGAAQGDHGDSVGAAWWEEAQQVRPHRRPSTLRILRMLYVLFLESPICLDLAASEFEYSSVSGVSHYKIGRWCPDFHT